MIPRNQGYSCKSRRVFDTRFQDGRYSFRRLCFHAQMSFSLRRVNLSWLSTWYNVKEKARENVTDVYSSNIIRARKCAQKSCVRRKCVAHAIACVHWSCQPVTTHWRSIPHISRAHSERETHTRHSTPSFQVLFSFLHSRLNRTYSHALTRTHTHSLSRKIFVRVGAFKV